MKLKTLSLAALFLLTALPVTATEFYRYVDSHGNVLFTDDLSQVPVDQREKVTTYEQSETPAAEALEADDKKAASIKSDADAVKASQEQERQRLEALGNELDKEYQGLSEERDRLDDEKNKAVTNAQIKAYNEKINAFNTRIKAYQEKRDTYTNAVKAYNARIEKEN